ncbi:MAG: hypothetical protein Q8S29_09995 [Phreatobacter sp.]|nr:hypothetical protein [Phreatobacter sp.]
MKKVTGMIRKLVLAFALVLPLALPGTAAAQGAAGSVAGWERQVAATGTVFFRCRAASCTAQSTVSYRPQQAGRMPSVAAFRQRQEETNRRMVEGSNGRLTRVDILDVAESERAGAKVLTAVKLLVAASGPNQYLATSLVMQGQKAFSIVSTAPTDAAARANLATFIPVVLLQGDLTPPPRRTP